MIDQDRANTPVPSQKLSIALPEYRTPNARPNCRSRTSGPKTFKSIALNDMHRKVSAWSIEVFSPVSVLRLNRIRGGFRRVAVRQRELKAWSRVGLMIARVLVEGCLRDKVRVEG